MIWTDDQKKAIDARPAQIVVSAAAGSGKTQVLSTRIVERIIDIENPVSVDKFLIVTFTKAAAAEMRERIGKTLRGYLQKEKDKDRRKYISNQISLLSGAQISTIDSFCYSVVREFFYEMDLPSDIALGDNNEMALLRLEALEDTINALYCALEKKKGGVLNEENLESAKLCEEFFKEELSSVLNGFDELTQSFASDKADSDFYAKQGSYDYTSMISELHKKAQSAAYPDRWLDKIADSYDEEKTKYEDTVFYKYPMEEFYEITKGIEKTLKETMEISIANNIGYENCLEKDLLNIEKIRTLTTYDEIYNFFENEELFGKLSGKKRDCDIYISTQIKKCRENMKSLAEKELLPLFSVSLDRCKQIRNEMKLQVKALCASARFLDKIYYDKMLKSRLIDFGACEHLALKIISADGKNLTEAGEAIRKKFDEVYVDETQDSNAMQDLLFSLVAGGRSFMVGDVKQSIYSFRNADPYIFMDKSKESSFNEESEKRKIFLSKNFRSRKCIVDAVNAVFDNLMTESICGIDYKSEHRLEFGADFMKEADEKNNCCIYVAEKGECIGGSSVAQAEFIAKKIRNMIESKEQIWDKETGEMRDIRFSDITILMRATNNRATIYEEALAGAGIPCYFDGGDALFDTGEVSRVIEILRLIDNSQCDIPLASTLRSPMFLFSETELLEIKHSGAKTFCDAFYGICSGKYLVRDELKNKCASFKRTLDRWRSASGFISISQLLERIYNETDIYASCLSMPDGQMRQANLNMLLDEADAFSKTSYKGLFNFINFIEKVKRSSLGASEAKLVSEKMDVVRITSIHKSKGLEYGVVFLAECEKSIHPSFTQAGGLVINTRGYLAMNVVNTTLRCRYNSPMKSVLASIKKKEETAEEMRLLYVALTRAREKLFVLGTSKTLDEFQVSTFNSFSEISSAIARSCSNYLSMVALGCGRIGEKYWKNEKIDISLNEEDDTTDISASIEEFINDKEVNSRLAYEYPYKNAVNIPNKTSVSSLKTTDVTLTGENGETVIAINKASAKGIVLKKASFEKKINQGAFYGTAHHKMLQNLSFNGESVNEQKDSLLKRGVLTKDEYDIISNEKIEAFLKSTIGKELKEAVKVWREESFVIYENASVLGNDFPGEEKICVQGIIDCFYEKSDGTIVLVDYKTDRYETPDEVIQKYKNQILYYEKALKLKFKDNVIKKYLYLMHKDDIIEI
ncbi:MAG: UvrD-helicase domain-containing protein [Clostridia bacterium]|nr:UvrD-helicase domain-containing protein [Clostridia bacterium]